MPAIILQGFSSASWCVPVQMIFAASTHLIDYTLIWLTYKDSNLDWEDQNLLCCHYTIGQSLWLAGRDLNPDKQDQNLLCFHYITCQSNMVGLGPQLFPDREDSTACRARCSCVNRPEEPTVVSVAGFEPAALSPQTRCDTRLRYTLNKEMNTNKRIRVYFSTKEVTLFWSVFHSIFIIYIPFLKFWSAWLDSNQRLPASKAGSLNQTEIHADKE